MAAMQTDVGAIVAEFGQGSTKIGMAGTMFPRYCQPTMYAIDGSSKVEEEAGNGEGDVDMAGAEGAGSDAATRAEEKPSLNITSVSPTKELRSPLTSDGNVSDWDAVEAMMEAAYRERLLVRSEDHPVLMTQPIRSDRKQRERWSEILMEKFGAPALFFSTDAVLICYANGRTSGLMADCGFGGTRVVPVQDGYVLRPGVHTNPIGGRAMDKYFLQRLQGEGQTIPPKLFNEIGIKPVTASFRDFYVLETVQEMRTALCRVSAKAWIEGQTKVPAQAFELPDGKTLDVHGDRFRVPEILFNPEPVEDLYPSAKPLQEMVLSSVLAVDVEVRKELFSNIILSGGNGFYNGMQNRLNREVSYLAGAARVRVLAAPIPEQRLAVWVGGSILGSLPGFHEMWVNRAEFLEHGTTVVERKCP